MLICICVILHTTGYDIFLKLKSIVETLIMFSYNQNVTNLINQMWVKFREILRKIFSPKHLFWSPKAPQKLLVIGKSKNYNSLQELKSNLSEEI